MQGYNIYVYIYTDIYIYTYEIKNMSRETIFLAIEHKEFILKIISVESKIVSDANSISEILWTAF